MEIINLKNTLETVKAMRINEVVIDSLESQSKIRGIDKNSSVVVYSKTPEKLLDVDTGIQNVTTLLNRMDLFDLEKSKFDLDEHNGNGKTLTIKQSRRKVTYTFARPDNIHAPKSVADDDDVATLSIDKDKFSLIQKAAQATGAANVELEGRGTEISLRLFDGVSDAFSDMISDDGNNGGNWKHQWRTDAFIMALKEVLKENETAEFSVGIRGILSIEISGLSFLLIPQVGE